MPPLDWYCEKLKCWMMSSACDLRRELASQAGGTKYRDAGCGKCNQTTTRESIVTEITEKVCRKCGIKKPLNEFSANKECALGREGTCKACKKEQVVQAYLRNKQGSTAIVSHQEQPKAVMQPLSLFIQMNDYPEIYAKMHEIAKKEFRTPEMQALYWLVGPIEFLTKKGNRNESA